MVAPRLILVLGDQLTPTLSALREGDRTRDVVVMAEVRDEATYVNHHKKKIALIFASMRKFAAALEEDGWTVAYGRYDDADTARSICGELMRRHKEYDADGVIATICGEWRLRQALDDCPLSIETLPDDRFITPQGMFRDWAEGRKSLRMEFFYREMRRKTGLLMDGDDPEGGEWNYDKENRKPAKRDLLMPAPMKHEPDAVTEEVLDLVEREFADNPGTLRPFWFATDATAAKRAASKFMKEALPSFGDYQDAMLQDEPFLYHSILSIYMNVGFLDPLEICEQAQAQYRDGNAPLNATEGYIRQILGWREFVRGIYDLEGPDYTSRNHLKAKRDLPGFYWTAETDMACMSAAIGQTLEEAYAHHIQRLMVTGTFALLAGIDPHQVHEWYLEIYADAYEWVEAPNVIGMSQFADGGLVGSKPYAASGNYIDKMSDYCRGCVYDVKTRHGEGACPFNPLYWDFLHRNRDQFDGNPRMAQMYRTWERMSEEKRDGALSSAAEILKALDEGERI
ncbi:cryptochrome/photolyase family protein [Pelagovum pacificum]|uniref:Cryptochrome/photolyase family protein n=1 Tax=Pelagovum pacificum TaxID=2588711 RepID=A0A5C5G7G7_9RHOB|nr:cryptochrome/photolyase family protein [Pelagovum pacificum]QQA41944.1 cryptochrome/photolyase family protein [Pelagovum pacificum]TNY30616.1 cryptochrome/photolyase family protein [Pelagovum pacificum]